MPANPDLFVLECHEMLKAIKKDIRSSAPMTGIDALSSDVEKALVNTPRHFFISGQYIREAYENHAVPLDCEQTISQPFIVALMTQLLKPRPQDHVLEIGTGSGYQTAILSRLVKNVYTVEIHPPLALKAQQHFEELKLENIHSRVGNGARGWPDHAPYDSIIVTAASEDLPRALLQQLKPNGRMVIPLGTQEEIQMLTLINKDGDDQITRQDILPVRFVPFRN